MMLRIAARSWVILAAAIAPLLLYPSSELHAAAQSSPIAVRSPDGRIDLKVHGAPAASGERPWWEVQFKGSTLLSGCRLGLTTVGDGELLQGARMVGEQRRAVDERVPVFFGKSAEAVNRFNEVRLVFETARSNQVVVVFRCFDDAVAFRYEIPGVGTGAVVTIRDEGTSFAVAGDPDALIQQLENFRTSHEHAVSRLPAGKVPRGVLLDLPLTLAWPDGTCAAITEAALRNYAGMALQRTAKGVGTDEWVSQLTPRPDGNKVVRTTPMLTPWRVVLIGDRAGALLESGTLYCLNEPVQIGDTRWIKPGKLTFSWWNGDVFDGKPGAPILSLEMARKYVDFCARHGIAFHSLTSTENTVTPWYVQTRPGVEPGPDTDVTRPRPGFDLEAIREYAAAKGVRLWTWVHQGALRGRVEEAFTAFEKLGWSGMMVDFFDHDDQETIEFAESVLESAARHHILIHLHGVWKPTGLQRTFPNLMNHEGALNLEYLKWSDRCTPEHDLMMAFTRLVAGPMDYHLGGFRAVPRSQFQARNVAPNVLGTRAHMMALYVCFDNPSPMVADYPMAYEGEPGFDFITAVPTWWDETRVVDAQVGEVLVVARRKGSTWYLGGITGKASKQLSIPLRFLGEHGYAMDLWRDAADAASQPNRVVVDHAPLGAARRLDVAVAEGGGFVAILKPAGP